MNSAQTAWMQITVIGAVLSVLGGVPARADSAPREHTQALLAALVRSHEVEHFEACGTAPMLRLNEVCSVGTECDADVRVADFIEVYNPTEQAAPLSCYVLASNDDLPFVPREQLAPSALKAWGEGQLGFRIAKKHDQVTLYRMRAIKGEPRLEVIDQVDIAEARALLYRSPDGGAWVARPALHPDWERGTSFDRPNPSPAPES